MKQQGDLNVYEAFQLRMDFLFKEFDNIYISFSGGKDSGVLLHLVMDYMMRKGITKKIGLFHQDFEAQYSHTTDYVTAMYEKFLSRVEPYWFCVPMATRTAVGNYEMYWYPWDEEKSDAWIRSIPKKPYVYSLSNNPMSTYKYRMTYREHAEQFGRWYGQKHGGGKTIGLLGLRMDESLRRYNGVVNKRYDYKGKKWITNVIADQAWTASPIYDWRVEDVWIANSRFRYPYNKLYDMFYLAGINIKEMRVASPFSDEAKHSLNLYRVIEPDTWAKLVGRVKGANFAAIYGKTKALGYRDLTLPEGHTWKSYTKFLLATLPDDIRNNYVEIFKTSIKFWARTGGGFSDEIIKEIEECGYQIRRNGVSNYTKDGKAKIIFYGVPDNTDDVKSTVDIPSWKRMAFCILKNDHLCAFMGFGPTKYQQDNRRAIREKYKNSL